MDVFVFGIGCSGTTMIYSLMQSIFSGLYGDRYFSTYEPFIWDRDKFNGPYEKVSGLFGKTSSISIEGIYNHLKTPLFVCSATKEDYISEEFFKHFSATHGPGQPHLAKLIRGNGRMSIFRALNPKARFLLIVRNPVDNINCSKYKFSHYGEDFYPTDYPRFCKQIKFENSRAWEEKYADWAQKQAEYCYQMNLAAITFADSDKNTKILEYDNFIRDKSSSVTEVFDFLGFTLNDYRADELRQTTGPSTASNTLTQTEYESIYHYYDLYLEMCERAGVAIGKSGMDIQNQYDGRCSIEAFDSLYKESTTNHLRRVIKKQAYEIRTLKKRLSEIK